MKTAKENIENLKQLRDQSSSNFNEVFGPNNNSKYDKKQFDFSGSPACHNLHNIIYFRHHYGVYGSSNVTSVFSERLTEYIARAINEMKYRIFQKALEIIDGDIRGFIADLKAEKETLEAMIKEIESSINTADKSQ